MRCLWLAIAAVAHLRADSIDFIIKGGVPLTEYFDTGRFFSRTGSAEYSAATRRYTVGVGAEWRPTDRLGAELSVLYKRMGYVGIITTSSGSLTATASYDVKGHSWDVPLVVKYRLSTRPPVVYAGGGGVLRYIGPVRAVGEREVRDRTGFPGAPPPQREGIDTSEPSDLRKRFYPGLTAVAGVEIPAGPLRLTPEFRYTHWTANIAAETGVLRFAPNQAEVLLGIVF